MNKINAWFWKIRCHIYKVEQKKDEVMSKFDRKIYKFDCFGGNISKFYFPICKKRQNCISNFIVYLVDQKKDSTNILWTSIFQTTLFLNWKFYSKNLNGSALRIRKSVFDDKFVRFKKNKINLMIEIIKPCMYQLKEVQSSLC